MTDRERKYLSDILYSIGHIQSFTEGINSFKDYRKNFLVKGAVERHLAIIGEATNKFIKETTHTSLKHASAIISLRNRLIHAYDNVDDRIIWTIIKKHLSPLKAEVTELLNKSD